MSDRRLPLRFGVSVVFALVCSNATLADGPPLPGAQHDGGEPNYNRAGWEH
jgi:hypothetical protein